MRDEPTERLVRIFYRAGLALIHQEDFDLTQRQLTLFMTCFLQSEPQTVRGLSARLNISKPAISRALDRLEELDLVKRRIDPLDRRSVIVQRRKRGRVLFHRLNTIVAEAATGTEDMIGGKPGDPGGGSPSESPGGRWSMCGATAVPLLLLGSLIA